MTLRAAWRGDDPRRNNQRKRYEAQVSRIAGEIASLLQEPADMAEARFERALAVAREQAGKPLGTARGDEYGAALARQARNLPASVYGSFTEGYDTPGLKQAKVLLDEVASEQPT